MMAKAGRFLYKVQDCPGIIAYAIRCFLFWASGFYWLISILRDLAFNYGLFKTQKMDVPVISLGNITTGGTGKTPACIWLIQKLMAMKASMPVLISRGYGNDEIFIFRNAHPDTPHFVHPKRVIAGRKAIEKHGKNICLVLDDAFQHRYIDRDLNIVLVDATEPFGFGYLLPRGFLREPLSHLKRADFIIITKSDMVGKKQLEQIQSQIFFYTKAPQAIAAHVPSCIHQLGKKEKYPVQTLQGLSVLAFSGIGNPESFVQSLEKNNINVLEKISFSDHHQYTENDKREILSLASELQAQGIITTAKDAVKLKNWHSLPIPVWIWEIEFQILEGEKDLLEKIRSVVEHRKNQ